MQPVSKKPIIALVVVVLLVVAGVSVFFALNKKPVEVPVVKVEEPAKPVYKVIGNSVQGRKIESYTYGAGEKKLVFVGGIHGGYEWNGVLLAYTYMDYLDKNLDSVPKNLSITIIPDANPDAVFAVTGKEGRFAIEDVSTDAKVLTSARFNSNNVDLNRNFDCKWQPKSTWQKKTVSAGRSAFSEPEGVAIRDFMTSEKPDAVVFWHSAAGSVYASQCKNGILPETLNIMNTYAKAAGYPAVKSFDAYATTGAADDWLASINIPAVTVELKTHDTIEWDKNLAGIKALIQYFSLKDKTTTIQNAVTFTNAPSWKVETKKLNDYFTDYIFTSPTYKGGSIGQILTVNVKVIDPKLPGNTVIFKCSADRESGTIKINGKDYTRCDIGSGLHLYRVAFEETGFAFDFSYSTSNDKDTEVIESIIKSFKF